MNLKDLIKNAYFKGMSISDIAIKYDISEERILEILGITKFESLFRNEKTWMQKYMKVQCIKERPNVTNFIHEGEIAYADITTMYIDPDGDVFMEIYDTFGMRIGNCNMKRFKSIK